MSILQFLTLITAGVRLGDAIIIGLLAVVIVMIRRAARD